MLVFFFGNPKVFSFESEGKILNKLTGERESALEDKQKLSIP